MKILDNWKLLLLASLTLGLAPFTPEPHIWGKLKWIFGGANGMQTADWFDTLLHGTPWLLLLISVAKLSTKKRPQ
jgi:hypothetical protein